MEFPLSVFLSFLLCSVLESSASFAVSSSHLRENLLVKEIRKHAQQNGTLFREPLQTIG